METYTNQEGNNKPASIISIWSDDTAVVHEQPERHRSLPRSQTSQTERPLYTIKRFCRKQTETHRDFLKRVSGEYCIVSVLSHQNVIGALDLRMENYSFYMEELGEPLSKKVLSCRQSIHTISKYIYQLIDAVCYIHGLGIAHRDIRLENLIIMRGGVVKLTGFHHSHVFKSPLQCQRLKSQGKVGVLSYQPPEIVLMWNRLSTPFTKNKCRRYSEKQQQTVGFFVQEQGQSHHHEKENVESYWATAVDNWSIGVILLYLLQGQKPWAVANTHLDPDYAYFMSHYSSRSFPSAKSLSQDLQDFLYGFLDSNPITRIDIQQIIDSEHSSH